MSRHGITLNMDMSNMMSIVGTTQSILGGQDEDYVTRIDIVLPIEFELPVGAYRQTFEDTIVEVVITTITKKEDDPIYSAAKDISFGASGSGLDTIPFEAFTDNRGKYPAVLITEIFHKRIASWTDKHSKTGMKMDFDYEEIQITGMPDNKEKIKALMVLNRLIKAEKWKDARAITYEDVTVFLESYFRKGINKPLILKINSLMSKSAYKDAVYDYVLPNIEESGAKKSLLKFEESHTDKSIEEEKDLLKIVEEVIDTVLRHYIESRHWIQPFWDGQRTVKHNDKRIVVPRTPKGETKIQPTLHVIFDMALSPLGIQVIRESDEGVGTLDFRFSHTSKNGIPLAVGIEFKLAHHKKIKRGICRQLPAYLKAIRSTSGIFVVMWFKDGKYFRDPKHFEKDGLAKWLSEQAKIVSSQQGLRISSELLDASIKPSASNL